MLNLRFLINIVIIIFVVLLQVFIFSKMTFHNIATPFIYILFILLYPPQSNRYLLLFLCFLLGLGVDMFENTGGIHAFASITVGFLSKYIIRMVSGTKFFEIEEFRFSDFNPGQWAVYAILMVFIHHFLLFFIESLSFSNFGGVMLRTAYSSIYTLIFVFFYLILFRKKAER
jgi:rod shape-determining protein MreD